MIKILQGNLHRSKTANDLLAQLVLEKDADLLIISEQYQDRNSPTWFADTLGTAAIWIPNPVKVPVENHGAGKGFVWVKSRGITYVSCYLTPSDRIPDLQEKLNLLEDAIREEEGKLLVAGDFNAKATEWGMPSTDSRGKNTGVGCQIRTNGDERRVHTNFQAARTEGNDTRCYFGIRNLSLTNKILEGN